MAGLYIHIPFCRKACHYCNFHFSTSLRLKNEFVDALLKEFSLKRYFTGDSPINTVYFGGGTPSLLDQSELDRIFTELFRLFPINADAEITLETNPDDINALQLARWRDRGINRLSIGVQSFFNEDLQWMNRAHSAEQSIHSIRAAQEAGITNLTIDLIYGVPGLSDDRWQTNVQTAVELGVQHLSCYALTVEEGTALEKMIAKRKVTNVDSENQARQFLLLMDWMKDAGYEHYEISNFAKPGFRSRHNSSYWSGELYCGFGPSAHSYNGIERHWNISNNALYIQSINSGILPIEKETLSKTQRLNEYTMTSLRTSEGLNLDYVRSEFGIEKAESILSAASSFMDTKKMIHCDNILTLTQTGKLFADGIAAALFADEEILSQH